MEGAGVHIFPNEFITNDLGIQISDIKALNLLKTDVSNQITPLIRGEHFSLDFSSGKVLLAEKASVGDKFSLFSTKKEFLKYFSG